MKKMRLVFLLLGLAFSFGLTAQKVQATCGSYGNCELSCLPREENCEAGLNHPECGGDSTCCYNALHARWACCIWY